MVNQWEPAAERSRKKLMNHAERVLEDLRYKPKYIYDIIVSMPRRLKVSLNTMEAGPNISLL